MRVFGVVTATGVLAAAMLSFSLPQSPSQPASTEPGGAVEATQQNGIVSKFFGRGAKPETTSIVKKGGRVALIPRADDVAGGVTSLSGMAFVPEPEAQAIAEGRPSTLLASAETAPSRPAASRGPALASLAEERQSIVDSMGDREPPVVRMHPLSSASPNEEGVALVARDAGSEAYDLRYSASGSFQKGGTADPAEAALLAPPEAVPADDVEPMNGATARTAAAAKSGKPGKAGAKAASRGTALAPLAEERQGATSSASSANAPAPNGIIRSRPVELPVNEPTSEAALASYVPESQSPAKNGAKSGSTKAAAAPATRGKQSYVVVSLNGRAIGSAIPMQPTKPAAKLPTPESAKEPESEVHVAMLGPSHAKQGSGAPVSFPGMSDALPVPQETAAPAAKKATFCPAGTVEKLEKGGDGKQKYCARTDKSGVAFKEGPTVLLYPSGKKRGDGNYVNGRLEGAFTEYGPTGKKLSEGAYKAGRKHGKWVFYWDNGKKQSEGEFREGARQGVWTYFDEAGRKSSSGEVRTAEKVEKKHGQWVFWHSNGTRKQEGKFRDGRKDGDWKTWDERGRVVSIVSFSNGEEQLQ